MMSGWFSLSTEVILFSLFILGVVGYILYSGLFTKVTVRTGCPPIKRITFAYKFKVGAYKNCGSLFREAHSIGPKLLLIGVFYTDPQKVLGKHCCYAVGSILSEEGSQIDTELLRKYEAAGFNIFSFPEAMHVVSTSFPYRTYLSVLFRLKVYPKLEKYIKERNLWAHPFLEIYKNGQIHFMVPLDRQGDFYVPEFRPPDRRKSEQEDSYSSTDVSGAESNSDDSSESGVLLPDSREASLTASSVLPRSDSRGRESSFKEPERTEGQEEEKNEQHHEDSKYRSLEGPMQQWTGVVGGEE
uniref:Testis expressed 264, ER-phagy receptor n=1 Tax=Oryzias latipes TaxID=8090 RepID=A0A3P9JLT4_ORYLA